MSNTFKIGDKFLLPIEISDFGNASGYFYGESLAGCEVPILPEDIPTLIPARTLTAIADYLEALGDALTLMPPEMRDPRDLADEIREMLS